MKYNNEIYFHIGYHKTGTTWLQQRFFNDHPDIINIVDSYQPWNDPLLRYLIGTSDRKFDRDRCVELFNRQLPDKITPCKRILVSCERLSGHPFSGGYDCFRIAERINDCFPEAKIICVVRNQLDIIASIYKQMIFEGYKGSLDSFLWGNNWKGTSFALEYYEYDLLVNKYQSLLNDDRVLFITYEEMKNNPDNFFQIMCNFLKVQLRNVGESKKHINISLPNRGLTILRFLNYFRKSELNYNPMFIIDTSLWKITVKILRLLPSKKNILNVDLRERLAEYYRPSNERLKLVVEGQTNKYL